MCLPNRITCEHSPCKRDSSTLCLSLGPFFFKGGMKSNAGCKDRGGRGCCLTVSRHAHRETLLEATLLATVAVDTDDGAVLVFQTPFILNVLLDTATEKALEGKAGVASERLPLSNWPCCVWGRGRRPALAPPASPCSPHKRAHHSGSRRPRPHTLYTGAPCR